MATPQFLLFFILLLFCLLYGNRWRHRNSLYILLFFPSVIIWNCINPVQTKLLLHRTSTDAVRYVPDGGESTVENTARSTREALITSRPACLPRDFTGFMKQHASRIEDIEAIPLTQVWVSTIRDASSRKVVVSIRKMSDWHEASAAPFWQITRQYGLPLRWSDDAIAVFAKHGKFSFGIQIVS